MAIFNLQDIQATPQQSVGVGGLTNVGDILAGASAVQKYGEGVGNNMQKMAFANKVREVASGVAPTITDANGNEVNNPAFAQALKPLMLEAYHTSVTTGDTTMMDDLQNFVRSVAPVKTPVDYTAVAQVEAEYNTFRQELEMLDAIVGREKTPEETAKRTELYNKYLELDNKYSQLTQGRHLQYKGGSQAYNATQAILAQGNVAKQEMEIAGMKDKAFQDILEVIKGTLGDFTTTNKTKLDSMSLWQNFADAYDLIASKSNEDIANSPAYVIGLVKAVNKMIEPNSSVMADDVNTMLGSQQASNIIDSLVGLVGNIASIAGIGSGKNIDDLKNKLAEGKITPEQIAKIKALGDQFKSVGAEAKVMIQTAQDYLGQSLLSLAQTSGGNRLALVKDANGQPMSVKAWAQTPDGKGALKALVASKIQASGVPSEIKNILSGAETIKAPVTAPAGAPAPATTPATTPAPAPTTTDAVTAPASAPSDSLNDKRTSAKIWFADAFKKLPTLQPAEQNKLKQAMQAEYKKAQALGIGSSVLGKKTARDFAIKSAPKREKVSPNSPLVSKTDTKPTWMR